MTAIFTYDYNSEYHPSMPMVELSIGLPSANTTLRLGGIVDSGADATIIPVRYLLELGARRSRKAFMRGITGSGTFVDLYPVAMQLGPLRQEFMEVVGVIDIDEAIVGRDILNYLSVTLNGPAAAVEVS